MEALQEKRLAATAMLPYWHQKQPIAVDMTKRSVVHLVINDAELYDESAGDLTLTARVVEMVEADNAREDGEVE